MTSLRDNPYDYRADKGYFNTWETKPNMPERSKQMQRKRQTKRIMFVRRSNLKEAMFNIGKEALRLEGKG
jgi:hypothetical protein